MSIGKAFFAVLNNRGIPLPTFRDQKTGKGSVTYTMVVVSFGLMFICCSLTITLVVNKWAGFFIVNDSSLATLKEAFSMALQMSGVSSTLYGVRKHQEKKAKKDFPSKSTKPVDNPDK